MSYVMLDRAEWRESVSLRALGMAGGRGGKPMSETSLVVRYADGNAVSTVSGSGIRWLAGRVSGGLALAAELEVGAAGEGASMVRPPRSSMVT